jgi:hypothetical protein
VPFRVGSHGLPEEVRRAGRKVRPTAHQDRLLIHLSYLFYALKRRFESEMADSAIDETLDDT